MWRPGWPRPGSHHRALSSAAAWRGVCARCCREISKARHPPDWKMAIMGPENPTGPFLSHRPRTCQQSGQSYIPALIIPSALTLNPSTRNHPNHYHLSPHLPFPVPPTKQTLLRDALALNLESTTPSPSCLGLHSATWIQTPRGTEVTSQRNPYDFIFYLIFISPHTF